MYGLCKQRPTILLRHKPASPRTHTLSQGCCPSTQAAVQMGISGLLLFKWRMKAENWMSFIAKDIPFLPKELFIWHINFVLHNTNSMEKETLAACDPRVYTIPQLVVLLILTCTFPYDKITQLKWQATYRIANSSLWDKQRKAWMQILAPGFFNTS